MNNEQHAWARAELDAVYPDPDHPVRKAVTALLSVWTRVDAEMSDGDQSDAVDVFSNLARLVPLDKPEDDGPRRVWAPASQYAATGAKFARVKIDTVPADRVWMYADRVCEIVAIRNGVIRVVFLEDREGAPKEYHGPVSDFDVDISHLVNLPSE